MYRFMLDLVATIALLGMVYFGSSNVISHLRNETTKQVKKGLSPMHTFTQSITGKEYNWEK